MSKTSELIKKLSDDNDEFKQAYEEARLKSDFVDLIFELEATYDLSGSQIAEKANKSRATINRIKSGEMNPSLKLMNEIAAPFGKQVKVSLVDK
ncbi:hypothetical protein AWM75_00695 [Aerococcus urinaehominis]|uniref:Uncharacterized protein n=1 Tax=Aerococcus urinaehominis TaxID=128944 RepID=A0A0X8FK66_9LACT|nr:helix-turn-helix domain-containing protein [Aerococcus urinaehominis]AMB98599.1 hypothetical protein AWM75_00695 [Aerococcus urinaehominis]SDL76243.1 DNA-binding transcriptional regulator, XRE-family HTH domain [Aerococcus urinaehominis]